MRRRLCLIAFVAALSACSSNQSIDAGRCAAVVLRAAQNIALECLLEVEAQCDMPAYDDGHGDF